jgi:drug/metabolite transporter (DMT)-like permease
MKKKDMSSLTTQFGSNSLRSREDELSIPGLNHDHFDDYDNDFNDDYGGNYNPDTSPLGYYSSKDLSKRRRDRLVLLLLLLAVWYIGAVVTITTSKELMNHLHMPFFLCSVQFLSASVFSALYMQFGETLVGFSSSNRSRKNAFSVPTALRWTVFAISTSYTFGFILTNSAFALVTAAFAETVKSTEPFTTVAIGLMLYRESVSWRTYFTLVPICFGVAFSCYNNDSFHALGFLLAFASNFCFSLRAVLAKRLNLIHNEHLDETQLFFHISTQGLLYLLPITLIFERRALYDLFFVRTLVLEGSSIGRFTGLVGLFMLNGLLFAVYNLVSYLVLRRTDLVTHSVLNAFRRVFIIMFTTLYFHLSLSAFNMIGVFVAVCGVIAFGLSKARDQN